MNTENINTDVFKPLLEDFLKENAQYFHTNIEKGYPHGIFLPYTFGAYYTSDPKVFYLGRDTYHWFEEEMFITDVDKYIEAFKQVDTPNKNGIVNVPRLQEWGKNAPDFWKVIPLVHLYIQTGKEYRSLEQLTDKDWDIVRSIGYGNVNCIEVQASLKAEDWYDPKFLNIDSYRRLKRNSRSLDSLKHTLDAYHPDFIIIFTWSDEEEVLFKELKDDFEWDSQRYDEKNHISVYLPLSKEYNTKIIWTAHPRKLKIKGKNTGEIVRFIGNIIKEL